MTQREQTTRWRIRQATTRRWLLDNLDGMGADATVFIAENAYSTPVGVATRTQRDAPMPAIATVGCP